METLVQILLIQYGKLLTLQFLDLLGQRAEVGHAASPQQLGRVVLEGHPVPIALGRGGETRELVELLITGHAFQLLLGQQGVLLVLFVLGNDQDDLFDLGLQEEKGLFDLQLVTLQS